MVCIGNSSLLWCLGLAMRVVRGTLHKMLVGGPTSRLYLDVGVVKYVSENYITLIIKMHPCSEQTLSA